MRDEDDGIAQQRTITNALSVVLMAEKLVAILPPSKTRVAHWVDSKTLAKWRGALLEEFLQGTDRVISKLSRRHPVEQYAMVDVKAIPALVMRAARRRGLAFIFFIPPGFGLPGMLVEDLSADVIQSMEIRRWERYHPSPR